MSESNKQQKKFTQQAENDFWDKVSLEIEREIDSRKSDSNKIIEYLKEKKNTITVGLGLKRYICEHFSGDFDKEENKYICEIRLDNGDIKNFKLDSFEDKDCSIDEYIDLMKVLGEKNGIIVTRQDAKRWLNVKECKRETIFEKLSFILEMETEYVSAFLNKELAEKGYNFRNPYEIIYYFCNKYKFKINKAQELIEKYNSIESNGNECNEYKHTSIFANEVKAIKNEEELLEYLKDNKANFTNISRTIQEEFKKLIDDIKTLLSLIYPNIDFNHDVLERILLEGIPRESKGKVKYNETIHDNIEPKCASEFVSIKDSNIKELLDNILKRDKIDKKLIGQSEPIRKDLILLSFFKFSLLTAGYKEIIENDKFGEESLALSEDQNDNPIQNMLYFREITDEMLLKNGMGELYIPNKFDNLILLSLCKKYSYEYFSNIIENSFPTEKVGKDCL
ncbi:UNVERIFIED_ORG: hypothetical protein B2H95_05645 [Clostridium botulinum]